MECRDVRPLADSYLSEQLLVETTQALVQHLETCPSCRAEFEGLRRMKLAAKSAFEHTASLQVSPEFRHLLAATLRDSSVRSTRSGWRQWLAFAAGLLLVFGTGLGITAVLPDGALAALAHLAAGDHQNCALTFKLVEKPVSLSEGATRFDPAFARLERVDLSAVMSEGPLRVVERHACVFEGQPFAHLVVIYKDTPVSLLVSDAERSGEAWWRRAGPHGMSSEGGFQVASFRSGHHAVFVVSTLPEADVEEVARAAIGPIAQALAGI